MARFKRDFNAAPYWHIINRGVDRQDIFGIDDDRRFFEWLLQRATEEDGVIVHAYALMANHFHLLVEFTSDDPSSAIQRLESSYSRWFNSRTRRRGPLYEHRFIAVPVAPEGQFWVAARYIHVNPIDIVGPSRLANYRWSSLPVYLGARPAPHWLTTKLLGSLIDPDRYLGRVLQRDPSDLESRGPLPPRLPRSLADLDAAVDTVLRDRGLAHGDVVSALQSFLARSLRLADVCQIARHYGLHESTIRSRAERARVLRVDEPSFHRLCDDVVHALLSGDRPSRSAFGV